MSAIVQSLLVVAIVATAMAYAAMKFMPAAWRTAIASRAASVAARSGLSEARVRRVEAKLSSGGACGSCDSCKACATTKRDEDDVLSTGSPESVYRAIPIRRA